MKPRGEFWCYGLMWSREAWCCEVKPRDEMNCFVLEPRIELRRGEAENWLGMTCSRGL